MSQFGVKAHFSAEIKTNRIQNYERLTRAYGHRLAAVHLAGFAPAFTLSLCDSEYARKPPTPIALGVSSKPKKKIKDAKTITTTEVENRSRINIFFFYNNMEDEIIFEDESFEYAAYQKIAPAAKTFLSAYLGEKLLHLEPEAYSEIEKAIKRNIYYQADSLPDILYNHCTIKDSEEWDKAFDNFINDKLPISWHNTEHWFDRDFCFDSNDEEDTFLENAYDFELNEEQKKAKKVVDVADSILNNTQNLTTFMRSGFPVFNAATRQFLIDTCIFDLKYLSTEGFIELQKQIDTMNEMILEDLHAIIQD